MSKTKNEVYTFSYGSVKIELTSEWMVVRQAPSYIPISNEALDLLTDVTDSRAFAFRNKKVDEFALSCCTDFLEVSCDISTMTIKSGIISVCLNEREIDLLDHAIGFYQSIKESLENE